MNKLRILGVALAAVLLLTFGYDAFAQETKTTPKPAAKTATKPPSPCKGLNETACKPKTECQWIVPKKGKQKPYCKLKTTPKKKESKETPAPKDAPAKK
jgi:hypothetical protein